MLDQCRQSLFCRKWAQKTSVSWRINSSPHPPIKLIVTGRRPSFMRIACQSCLSPLPDPQRWQKYTHTHTHTHTHTLYPHLHYSSTTDQLSCWIPNRTHPINLSQAGIRDWYRGRGTTASQRARYKRWVTEKLAWKIEGLDLLIADTSL